jgi:peptidoglycan/xylan/chitin deacetylase (PgdA/CDA1 family)
VTPAMPSNSARTAIPVVVFHSVSDRSGSPIWTLPEATFRRHIRAIAESGRTSMSFGDLANGLAGRHTMPERPVVVTFDDGFADNLDSAAVCDEHRLHASFFITTDYLGRDDMLTAAQVRELAALPNVEVGSHTISHRRLDELSRGEIDRELRDSRERLEQVLSAPVTTLAYPHGNYDERVKKSAAVAGYTGAAAVRMALSHSGDDPFAVARYIISTRTTDAQVADILAGRGRLAAGHERLITRGYRWVRRGRAIAGQGTRHGPEAKRLAGGRGRGAADLGARGTRPEQGAEER